jgi:hypothetical protein
VRALRAWVGRSRGGAIGFVCWELIEWFCVLCAWLFSRCLCACLCRRVAAPLLRRVSPASCVLGWSLGLSLVLGGGPVALLGFAASKSHAPARRPWRSAFTPRSSRAGAPLFRTHTAHARLRCLLRVARRCCSHPHARPARHPVVWVSVCFACVLVVFRPLVWPWGVFRRVDVVQDRRNLACVQQGDQTWTFPLQSPRTTSRWLTSQIYL